MDDKVSKDKYISRWVLELCYMKRNQKLCTKNKMMIDRWKRSKATKEAKPVKNIRKNPQSFLKIWTLQKEIADSHKLQGHTYK